MKAVILAAGKGTRLRPYSEFMPKALMPIDIRDGSFRTIIEKLVDQISRAGIRDIIVVVNYRAEMIMTCLGDGAHLGVRISYVMQSRLDGNAGAFYRAQHLLGDEPVLVTDCDNDISDDELFAAMRVRHEETGAECTVAVCPVEEVQKFAIIKTDRSGRPVDIYEKPEDRQEWGNLAKSGMMMFSSGLAQKDRAIARTPAGEYTTTQIIKHCIEQDLSLELYSIEGGFHDIGTWNEYLPILRSRLTESAT